MRQASRIQHNRLVLWRPFEPCVWPTPQSTIDRCLSGRRQAHHQRKLSARSHIHPQSCTSSPSSPTCVLFIVQDPERNVFDQRHLEYELNATHSVRTFRVSFDRVLADSRLEPTSRKLLYTPPHTPHKSYEVSTLYFRAGYAPSDYTSEEHWSARLHLERSAAIKCPSILTHLAGSKKVQQVLATPESPHLARFLPDKASSSAVLETLLTKPPPVSQRGLSPPTPRQPSSTSSSPSAKAAATMSTAQTFLASSSRYRSPIGRPTFSWR
jgi:hypothetical protein